MAHAPGAIVGGKYRLVRVLARGGGGTVWVAEHVALGTRCAVKLIDPTLLSDRTMRARFEREARAAAQIRSPYVVKVHDYGADEGVPYIAMELLEGETLGQRLKRTQRLPIAEAAKIVHEVAAGLRPAHALGIVHRDLKPANIFLATTPEGHEIAKLLDFGIAKETLNAIVGESTRTGELVGSPHFMSPEQIRSEKAIDLRADLWALGIILYRALTGYLPFPGDVLTQVITRIMVDPLPRASSYLPDAPPELDAFFERALTRDRDHRFQTVAELVDAFDRVAGIQAAQPVIGAPSVPPAPLAIPPPPRATPIPAPQIAMPMLPPGARDARGWEAGAQDAKGDPQPQWQLGTDTPPSIGTFPRANTARTTPPPNEAATSRRGLWIALAALAFCALIALAWLLRRGDAPPSNAGPAAPSTSASAIPAPTATPAIEPPAIPPSATASAAPSTSASAEPSATSSSSAPRATPQPRPTTSQKRVYTIE